MIKRAIIAILIIGVGAALLGAVAVFVFIDDAIVVSFLIKRLETATDTRIRYAADAAITRTTAPTLSLRKLVIDDVEGRYRLEMRSLLVQISLPELLLGRLDVERLWLGDTRVQMSQDSTARTSPVATDAKALLDLSALPLLPSFDNVQISEFSIVDATGRLLLPAIRLSGGSLQLNPGQGTLVSSARLEVEQESFALNASLSGLQKTPIRRPLPFSITATGDVAEASAVGQLQFDQPAVRVQATLNTHVPDLQRFPVETAVAIPGEFTATAEVKGSLEQLALEGLSADWKGAGQSSATLSGRVGKVREMKDIQLNFTGQLDEAGWLAPVWPETVGSLDKANVAAQLSGDRSHLRLRDLSVHATTADGLDLSLTGQLGLANVLSAPETENIEADLVFSAPTTHAARALLFDTVPEFGPITGRTEIRSTRGDPAFENILVETRDEQGIQVNLKGRIAQFPLAPNKPNKGYDLDVSMQATNTSVMTERAGVELPLNGPLVLTFRIEGDTQALQLNQVNLSARDTRTTVLSATGRILFREWEQEDPLKAVDLVLDDRARGAGILRAWVEQEFPPLAYSAHARLHTVDGQHRIDDFRLTTTPGQPLVLSNTGSAARVTFLPEFRIEGIRVDASAKSDDIARLNALFKLDNEIPALGPLAVRATVTGTDRKLLVDKVLLTGGQENVLRLETKGRLGYLSAAGHWRLEHTDLAVNALGASSQALADALGYHIPPLGPVLMRASVTDKDETLGVDTITIRVGDAGKPALQSQGRIGDLYALSGIKLVTELNLGGRALADFADTHALPELGALTGRMVISDGGGSLGIDSLHVESTRSELFSLYVDGQFDDFDKPDTLELNTRVTARDMKLLGALLDRDWPDHGRVEFTGKLRGADHTSAFNATLSSGKENIDIVLSGDLDKTPPQIEGRITATNFFVPDLFERERQKIAERRGKQKTGREKQVVFSRTPLDLDWLQAVDLDLAVNIVSFDRTQSAAESADARISLKSGQLSVHPATVVYPKGKANLDLQLSAKDALEARLAFKGENLDPWRGLHLYDPSLDRTYEPENARLDVDIALSSSGDSLHQLAADLQGNFYVAVRNGKISTSKLKLLFVDIIGWATSLTEHRYDHVNCGVADLSIRQGVVDTKAFFMDMKDISIAGEGTIDLGQERINYVFIPRKKSRVILKAEPVNVKGPLNDPRITAIPVKSLALQAGKLGTLLFAPYVFAGILAGEYATGELKRSGNDSSACLKYLATHSAGDQVLH